MNNSSCPHNIIKPWGIDFDLPQFRWASFFITDRRTPDFVFSKPSKLMESQIDFLVTQLRFKSRRWVVCFSNSITHIRKISAYVATSFVLSTGLTAEVKDPKDLVEYAFNDYRESSPGIYQPMQVCSLLIVPYFDPTYIGYMKARPKIVELLTKRKEQEKPFMFSLYHPKLPVGEQDIAKFSAGLSDFFGEQAKDLFSNKFTKFVVLKGDE